jgi:hypothetical protein
MTKSDRIAAKDSDTRLLRQCAEFVGVVAPERHFSVKSMLRSEGRSAFPDCFAFIRPIRPLGISPKTKWMKPFYNCRCALFALAGFRNV